LVEALKAAEKILKRIPIVSRESEPSYTMICHGCGARDSESSKPYCWCLELEGALVGVRVAIKKAGGK